LNTSSHSSIPIRSLTTAALLGLALYFAFSGLRIATWEQLLPLFEWSETTLFGYIGKTWGAAFAVVEAFHLLAMAVMGGAILLSDARLLGLAFTDTPIRDITQPAHKVFVWALAVILLTGVFMACGVAMKIYYLTVFWYKMLALGAGMLFVFFIKQPLLAKNPDAANPWVLRAVAIASLMVWFTVAACGRWIGFSG
jgi:hypothetical protein